MLKGPYFTPRHEIINWINQTLSLSLAKIQQLGAGNVYCHLLDAAYPGKVPLNKVKWRAYQQIDFIHNFKILQSCFDHLGISKTIEVYYRDIKVQRLVKAKYQDNLEMIQWMKWELSEKIVGNKSYRPLERRQFQQINLEFSPKIGLSKSSSNLHIHSNKQNISFVNNTLDTSRNSFKKCRNSIGSLTNRDQLATSKQTAANRSYKKNETKEESLHIPQRSRISRMDRVHTETGSLILRDIAYQFILQADQDQSF